MRPLSTQWIAILGLLLTSTAIAAETSKPSGPKTIDPPKFRSLYRASQNSLKPLDCPQTFTSIFELREQHLQQAKQALQDILPPHHTTQALRPGTPDIDVPGEALDQLTNGARLAERLLGLQYDLNHTAGIDSLILSAEGEEQTLSLLELLTDGYKENVDSFDYGFRMTDFIKMNRFTRAQHLKSGLATSLLLTTAGLLVTGRLMSWPTLEYLAALPGLGLITLIGNETYKAISWMMFRFGSHKNNRGYSPDGRISKMMEWLVKQNLNPPKQHNNSVYVISDRITTNSPLIDKLVTGKVVCKSDATLVCLFESLSYSEYETEDRLRRQRIERPLTDSRLLPNELRSKSIPIEDVYSSMKELPQRSLYRDIILSFSPETNEPRLQVVLRSPRHGQDRTYKAEAR